MAEEKSAPKKEKAPKKDAAPADAAVKPAAPADAKPVKEKAPKVPSDKSDKATAPAAGAEGAPAPAGDAKPVELVHGVPKAPSAEDLLKEELGAIKVRKAKGSKNVTSGIAHVTASFNNTIVAITDQKGQVIAWSSAGKCNFRGSRKSTAYAAQIVAQDAARNAMAHGLKDVQIRVSGPGLGRDSAIRALQAIGLEISSIIDVTPVPHNGCRPRKRRRV
jgi:small subunit ribosomal protein S11